MRKILFLLFTLLFHETFAQTSCLNDKDVQEVTASIVLKLDGEPNYCDPNTNYYKTVSSLIALKNLEMKPVYLDAPLNQSIVTENYWDYFKNGVDKIGDADSSQPECAWGIAYATIEADGTKFIGICPVFYTYQSSYDALPLLLHERRHLDGYYHATCSGGQFKGTDGGCDEKIWDHGAYAVSIETGLKIAIGATNLPLIDKFRLMTETLSLGHARFNESFAQIGLEGIFLTKKETNSTYIFQGNTLIKTSIPANGTAVSRTFSLLVQPDDKSDIFSPDVFWNSNQKFPSIGGLAYQYNSLPTDERPSAFDLFNDTNGGYVVLGNTVSVKIGEMNAYVDIELPWEPTQTFSILELNWPSVDSFFVRNEKGESLQIKINFDENGYYKSNEIIQIADPAPDFKNIIYFDGKRLGLSNSGEIKEFDQNNGWQIYAPLAEYSFSNMTRPFAWSKDLWMK